MKETFRSKLQHGWNAFSSRDPTNPFTFANVGPSTSIRPDRVRISVSNERSIIASVYNRLGMDVAAVSIQHVRLDDNKRFLSTIDSDLNECLNLSANLDQISRAFFQDVVMSMCDEGCVAIVPTETDDDPNRPGALIGSYDIQAWRTGKIIEWYPQHVRVQLYNERSGRREELVLPKSTIAIIENPLYAVMNEPNSTLKRLTRKLNILDAIDEQNGAGKLDLIIQLPYVVKTEARREQAETRRKDIEMQLSGSNFGVAYTDGTEKITQLNRPVENNLMAQITYLTSMFYNQLGVTESVFDGTADEKTMLNYYNRTVEPILAAIVDEMKRKFLTKTARSQAQTIMYFRDPFKAVPVSELADIGDKFTRNEILSSNDMRGIIGYKPSSDPKADELRNKNINASVPTPASDPIPADDNTKGENQNGKEI